MKKLILCVVVIMIILPMICLGQEVIRLKSAKDSMATTDGAYLDTLYYRNIDISMIDFNRPDSNKIAHILFRIDTVADTTLSVGSAWYDSGHVPCIIAEIRYLVDKAYPVASDTLNAAGMQTGQWLSIADTLGAVAQWGFRPVKLLPIARYVDLRFRDKNDVRKRGNKHGKFIEFILEALRGN